MGNYHYLISGLPELRFDVEKLKLSMTDIKTELEENLSFADRQWTRCFFMPYDNTNLLKLLSDPEAEIDFQGNMNREELLDVILQFKEMDEPNDPSIYPYYKKFIPAYLNNKIMFGGMSWEDYLSSLFYDYAIRSSNHLISEWYNFNLNITNLFAAFNCMKYGYDREKMIVGSSEVANAIRYGNSKDFGITAIFPEVEMFLQIAEESNIYERERKIDLLKWEWLEENSFFHYFDVEHLFVYLIRLEILVRWIRLEKETGAKVFRDMIGQLQHAFEFSDEFMVKKVK